MLAFPALILALFHFGLIDGVIVTGGLNVTLAMFSGRSDPTWTLQPKDTSYVPIKQSLDALKVTYSAREMPPRLGYKGFLVGSMTNVVLIVGPETKKLQLLLLKSIPKGVLPSGSIDDMKKEIDSGKVKASTTAPASPARGPKRGKRFEPLLGMWFSSLRTTMCNNCYNYANTLITDNFAQPGFGTGQLFGQMNGASVQQAAVSDGLIALYPQPGAAAPVPPAPAGARHLVALAVDPGTPQRLGDFHLYRLDQNGFWSHKPGSTPVTALDNAGAFITDPRIANMGNYHFVSFMTSDYATVNIAGNRPCLY
ncbi:uncharacterized protein [Montipora foliosa]|uniref:uncharacterized protein n=1 Tax=Montipora foliosa TaxID=591990 RepID=UPI0035F21581